MRLLYEISKRMSCRLLIQQETMFFMFHGSKVSLIKWINKLKNFIENLVHRVFGIHYIIGTLLLFHSVTQSYPTLCDPTDCSKPGLPVHHHIPEFAQTHVHRVSDAIQSHLLLSPSPPTFNLSQHQGHF